MLQWLFGKGNRATRAEDCVWMSRAARLTGIRREVERVAGAGQSVLVVALALTDFDELVGALAQHQPLRCRDLFGGDALRHQLGRVGSVAVALVGTLPADVEPGAGVRVEVLVCGRNEARVADEAILGFADRLGARARVTFHLSLDDALLQRQTESIKPILGRLGLTEDEAISHPMVTRAIARIQSK
ncbi:MAG TPA: hypothetical protein VGX21_06890 [Methylomirabilota bacterium]|nr:hypothetical protein [Methylomirabilota bacterium]